MKRLLFLMLIFGCQSINSNTECDMRYLKEYSEQYKYEHNIINNGLPKDFCHNIKKSYMCDSTLALIYMNLVLLKVYNEHLRCCEQSYAIRPLYFDGVPDYITTLNDNNCIYYYLIQNSDFRDSEYITTAIAYHNVLRDSLFFNHKLIQEEFLKVKEMKSNLGHGTN